MRIIGGTHSGFIIRPPKNIQARPTTDMAKESLFNILNNRFDFETLTVLDLFTGAGGICLEFASRGVQRVVTVDISPVSTRFVSEVQKQLNLTNLQTAKADAFRYLENTAETFDIIFADPPYAMQNIETLQKTVKQRQLLKPGGVLIIEHIQNLRMDTEGLTETRKYGQTCFSFYAFQ